MVKKFLIALLLMALFIPAAALADLQVIDEAGVVDAEMEQLITQVIDDVEKKHQVDLVVLVTYDVPDDYSDSLWRVEEYADNYYDDNGYGMGEDASGLLYLIDLNNYVQWVSTCGKLVDDMSDADIDRIQDAAQLYLSDGQYGNGALSAAEEISEIMDEQSVDACYHSENDGQQDGKPAGKLCTLKVFAAIIVLLSLGGMPAW